MNAEAVVKAQLDAYNAKDIEAFMACWAKDAEIYSHPDTLLAKGHDDIKARHVVRFEEPDLHGRLIRRLCLGDRVVDMECVTRNFPEGIGFLDVVAIYEVTDKTISKAWFVSGVPRFTP